WAASDFSAAFAASAGACGDDGSSGDAQAQGRSAAGVGRPWLPGRYQGELGDIRPERLARLAEEAGRPLLLLLDGPEEMPPTLAHRLAEWTAGTTEWLRAHGARLVVACRAEYWERAGAHFPAELLYGEAPGAEGQLLPACVRLGDLTESEARRARLRYGIPEDALTAADARHPLTLRLLSEIRAALPPPSNGRPGEDGAPAGPPDEHAAGTARPSRPETEPENRAPGGPGQEQRSGVDREPGGRGWCGPGPQGPGWGDRGSERRVPDSPGAGNQRRSDREPEEGQGWCGSGPEGRVSGDRGGREEQRRHGSGAERPGRDGWTPQAEWPDGWGRPEQQGQGQGQGNGHG
ncbi:hypothetical protein PV379_48705, partial [Streptomyces caniscabiei]|nr:hypothetical protein [Streptomyces caniscabiei]